MSRNHGGPELGEVRKNRNADRAVKVSDDGGVESLGIPVDVTAPNLHLERLRRDIYAFGRGVDMRGDRIGASASGLALKQEFAGLDLDTNGLERGMQNGLAGFFWFYACLKGRKDNAPEITVTFSRDIITVESEAIQMCKDSVGILSDETILENHPWVKNAAEEKKRIAREQAEKAKAFGAEYENLKESGDEGSRILETPGGDAGSDRAQASA